MTAEEKLRLARRALRLISIGLKECESYWGGTTCVTNGRKKTAKYGADRWCNTCIANEALRNTR